MTLRIGLCPPRVHQQHHQLLPDVCVCVCVRVHVRGYVYVHPLMCVRVCWCVCMSPRSGATHSKHE